MLSPRLQFFWHFHKWTHYGKPINIASQNWFCFYSISTKCWEIARSVHVIFDEKTIIPHVWFLSCMTSVLTLYCTGVHHILQMYALARYTFYFLTLVWFQLYEKSPVRVKIWTKKEKEAKILFCIYMAYDMVQGSLYTWRGNSFLLVKIGGKPNMSRVRAHCSNVFY